MEVTDRRSGFPDSVLPDIAFAISHYPLQPPRDIMLRFCGLNFSPIGGHCACRSRLVKLDVSP
jgi:hypothetical protein